MSKPLETIDLKEANQKIKQVENILNQQFIDENEFKKNISELKENEKAQIYYRIAETYPHFLELLNLFLAPEEIDRFHPNTENVKRLSFTYKRLHDATKLIKHKIDVSKNDGQNFDIFLQIMPGAMVGSLYGTGLLKE